MQTKVRIQRLLEFIESVCWNDKVISLEHIKSGLQAGINEQNEEYCDIYATAEVRTDDWHLGRIIFFINHPEKINKIQIDNICDNGLIYPIPFIQDGNHRFLAAAYLYTCGIMNTINCDYGGREDLLDYLTGVSDECPTEPI